MKKPIANIARIISRTHLWIMFMTLIPVQPAVAQHQVSTRPYKVWIDRAYGTTVSGVLNQVGENQVQILPSIYTGHQSPGDLHQLNIPAADIQQIRLRRKGKVGRGILIGTAAGVVTGVIIGLAAGDDPDCNYNPNNPSPFGHIVGSLCESMHRTAGQKAAAAGLGLGLAGGVAGAVIGSIKIKIPINGSNENFKSARARLERYAGGM